MNTEITEVAEAATETEDNEHALNALLSVDESAVHREKDRPMSSRNKRQKTFDNSTRRELSDFEHVKAEIN